MWNYRTLTIRNKLTLMMMLICVISLVLAGALFVIGGYRFSRQNAIDNLVTQAKMMAESCQVSVLFNDPEDAEANLNILRSQPSIVYADVRIEGDRIFAEYTSPQASAGMDSVRRCDRQNGYVFERGFLIVCRDIMNDGQRIATVCLCSDLEPLQAMLAKNIAMALVIVVGIVLVAYLLSWRFQRFISKPILDLTDVARRVKTDKEYSVRVEKTCDDEIGILIDSFNEMLEQISIHKSQLIEMNAQLEEKVKERTAELTAEISERKRTEKQLLFKTMLQEAQSEASIDGILVVDDAGQVISVNGRFCQMWNLSEDVVKSKDDKAFLQHVLDELASPDEFLEKVEYLYSNKDQRSRDEITFKDGRIFDRYSAPLLGTDSLYYGRIWYFRDITERIQKEKKIRQMQEELIDSSRRAGMAEVATDVLHNVGNVLNSVNVSTTLIHDTVMNSEVPNVKKVAEMIQSHLDDLDAFLQSDPKGRYIPSYLVKAAELLSNEQETVIGRLGSLVEDVNHIKSIVKMQQEYAKVSGVETASAVDQLIEDAIRINETGLVRNKIRIERDYEDLGRVLIDKQRVIQILVNVISNAKFALAHDQCVTRILKIRSFKKDDRLRIEVIDNGVGISQEDLTKIFRHGFTTRKEGHGFGLHSGALAAKEMSGSLSVHSDGPGRGATFTLELPFKAVDADVQADVAPSA